MSAILGMINKDGRPLAAGELGAAMAAISQYGGDGAQVWTCGPVGFGHHLRSLSGKAGPDRLPLSRGPLTITADLRLDNRVELVAALELPAAEQRATSDSELVVRAYERWGEKCPEYLVGDYAFAIWDRAGHKLFCARDPIGSRPFYYSDTPNAFAFSSDIRALLALPDVPTRVDELEIARHLLAHSYGRPENRRTFFTDVWKLPFGHALTLASGELRLQRHWRPEELPEIRLPTLNDYADRLYELVNRAVADRLPPDVPVGFHLSGGLDSSSIAVLGARILRARGEEPPPVFSWSAAPSGRIEDSEHRRIGAICHQEGLTPDYFDSPSEERWWGFEEEDVSVKPVFTMRSEQSVQKKAAELGLRLMLSGWGGDEGASFNGRGLASQYLIAGEWFALAEYLQVAKIPRQPRHVAAVARQCWNAIVLPLLPDSVHRQISFREARRRLGTPFIHPEFARRIQPLLGTPSPHLRVSPGGRACQLRLYHHGHLSARMESWAANGADHGITYAYPLTDRRVLEFVYGLPGSMYYRKGYNRYLYRYTMDRILPAGVAWDSVKQDISITESIQNPPPAQERHKRLARLNAGLLSQANPWVDVPRLRQVIEASSSGVLPATALHALNCLAIWRRWQSEGSLALDR